MSVASITEPTLRGVLIGLPALAVATRLARIKAGRAVALLQDATPLVLVLAWVGLLISLLQGAWLTAALAAVLAVYHLGLVYRLARRRAAPGWVTHAPTTTLALANVYIDNDEMGESARQLVAVNADIVVIVETTPAFRAAFDRVGGSERYPHRTFDADDDSDYAVSMYCSVEPHEMGMIDIGELRVASAMVPVGGTVLHVVGAIPTAAVDPGGYATWKRQMEALSIFASRRRSPLVIAGDLNTTIHRAAYRDLAQAGLDDAHDDLGLGLRPSFKLAATGLLARLGPLVRLDHALTNRWVWATEVHDLDNAGSDHRPFVATLAVRRSRGARPPAGPRPVRAEQPWPLVHATTADAQRVLPPSDAPEASPTAPTSDKSTRSPMPLRPCFQPSTDRIQ